MRQGQPSHHCAKGFTLTAPQQGEDVFDVSSRSAGEMVVLLIIALLAGYVGP